MRKACFLMAILSLLCIVGGCAMSQTSPVYGGVVTMGVKGPVAGVDNSVKPEKTGEAESKAIVFFAKGDSSISAAMANGSITKVHHIDCEVFSILGVYATYKTIVYGE